MAQLSFEAETHGELVVKVRRWLASVEGQEVGNLAPHEVVEQSAELTKEALRIIAAAAPEPIAQNEIVKALTNAGYKATDATKQAVLDGLDSVKLARDASKTAVYQMNTAVARQILKTIRR
jgi:hypothetical protein